MDFIILFSLFVIFPTILLLKLSLKGLDKLLDSLFSSPNHSTSSSLPDDSKTYVPDITPTTVASQQIDNSYNTCHLIWRGTQVITESSFSRPNYVKQGYVWAALFYISVKHIRKQATVDQIFSHFKSSATPSPSKFYYSGKNIFTAKCAYREFAKELTNTIIDPRTDNGLNQLWYLLSRKLYAFPLVHHQSKEQFFHFAELLIQDSKKYLTK